MAKEYLAFQFQTNWNVPPSTPMIGTSTPFSDPDDEDDDVYGVCKKLPSLGQQRKATSDELTTYFALPGLDNAEPSGVLKWWKGNAKLLPTLSRMAAQFLALPASSSEAERVFSLAGRFHTNDRKGFSEGRLSVCIEAAYNN